MLLSEHNNNKQNSEVQEAVIREFAESQKIEIGKWAKEVGNSPRANRRLESIVKSLSPGDEILVSDISRVSRKMIEIIHIILLCIERKVTLRSVSDGYVFEDNIDSKTLAFTFGLVSEIERKLVSIRTKEALALIRSKGVVLGRPKGSQQMGRLEPYKEQIEKDLKDPSLTYAQIAEKYNVSLSSFKRFLKEYLPIRKRRRRNNDSMCQYANEIPEVDNSDISIFAYWHIESLLFLYTDTGVYSEQASIRSHQRIYIHFFYLAGKTQ